MKNYFNDETNYNMGQFDESFNVVLGIKKAESEFDWFNNPYISLNVYQAEHKEESKSITPSTNLVKC